MIFGYSVTNTLKWVSFNKPINIFDVSGEAAIWRRPSGLNLNNVNDGLLSTYSVGSSTQAPSGTALGVDNRIFSYPQLVSDIFRDGNNVTPYIYKDLYFDLQTAGQVDASVFTWECGFNFDVYTGSWFQCDFVGACAGSPCGTAQVVGGIRACCNECYCRCFRSVTCRNRVTVNTFARYVYVPHIGFTNIGTIYSNFSSCNNC
jgi:hypothetical protein